MKIEIYIIKINVSTIIVKRYRLNNSISLSQRLVPTLNWVFENKSMVTGILTQPSGRKQFASRRKR